MVEINLLSLNNRLISYLRDMQTYKHKHLVNSHVSY